MPGAKTKPSQSYSLGIFITAQDQKRGGFIQAAGELLSGRKTTHWIWYIFPQIRGISDSVMSRKYAIQSLDHARDYLNTDPLGYRLGQAVQILHNSEVEDVRELMGSDADVLKLQASLTLFQHVARAEDKDIFQSVLDKYFGGKTHAQTDAILLALQ